MSVGQWLSVSECVRLTTTGILHDSLLTHSELGSHQPDRGPSTINSLSPMNVQQSMMTQALRRWRIIPVITIEDPKHAGPLAAALLSGGIPIAEVTLRTPTA